MTTIILMLAGVAVLKILLELADASLKKKKRRKTARTNTKKSNSTARSTHSRRDTSKTAKPDDVILASSLSKISGTDFERLLALYFRDHGYQVQEVGVGGNDGGVDLVITDKRGEKTAVQAKCYNDNNKVSVMTVRELVGAKRNHGCILALLVTTSDLTPHAKAEAESLKIEYWHGATLIGKLKKWNKWRGSA
jgi:restriction system protein